MGLLVMVAKSTILVRREREMEIKERERKRKKERDKEGCGGRHGCGDIIGVDGIKP